MKKVIYIIAALLIQLNVTAQDITANDMLVLIQCNEYDCFANDVMDKGFEVALTKEQDGYKLYSYKTEQVYVNKSNPDIAKPNYIDYILHNSDKAIKVKYTVGAEEQYKELLESFKNTGFKYVKTTKTNSVYDNTAVIYNCEEHKDLQLRITFYMKKEQGREYKEYEFELIRPMAS